MERRSASLHLTTIAWAALTAILLLGPPQPVPRMPQPGDKLGHLILFLVLGLLLFRSFTAVPRLKRPLVMAVVTAIFYGALLELAQGIVGYREAEWWDLAADIVGVGIFVAARRLWIRNRWSTFGTPDSRL